MINTKLKTRSIAMALTLLSVALTGCIGAEESAVSPEQPENSGELSEWGVYYTASISSLVDKVHRGQLERMALKARRDQLERTALTALTGQMARMALKARRGHRVRRGQLERTERTELTELTEPFLQSWKCLLRSRLSSTSLTGYSKGRSHSTGALRTILTSHQYLLPIPSDLVPVQTAISTLQESTRVGTSCLSPCP